MSFKAELEALIANANSSLEDLEEVLRRAQARSSHGQSVDANDGDVREIQTQIDTIRQRILTSLVDIRDSYHHDQERLSDLEGELKLDLENVRQCAIDYFIKGEYQECERLLTFLAKVQPDDENLQSFLKLSQRKQLEHEAENSEQAYREQQLAVERRQQEVDGPAKTNFSRDQVERKGGAEPASPLAGARESGGPLSVFETEAEEQPERIEPQILAEIELQTAAYINETYRSLPRPTKARLLMWVTVVGMLSATTLFWFSRLRPGSSTPDSLSPQHSKVAEQVLPEGALGSLRQQAQSQLDAQAILAVPESPAEKERPALAGATSTSFAPWIQPPRSDASSKPAMATDRASFQPSSAKVQKPSERNSAREQGTLPNRPASAPASVSRTTSSGRLVTTPQISPDLLLELDGRIQAKDFDHARLLLARLETAFPGNPELRTPGERLRVDAAKQQSLALMWIEKAWAAQLAGRYVTPREDNVLVYCNLALEADPGNQRAADLKKEIVKRAVAQVDEWIQRGKFDAARLYYASMDYLASGDAAFPYPRPELKRELDRLEFAAYTVVHDHKFGSCSGILKFNSHAVSYVPSGDSVDGFLENLKSISTSEDGRWLSIAYRDKTFRFKRGNGTSIGTVYQELIARMANERSILARHNH